MNRLVESPTVCVRPETLRSIATHCRPSPLPRTGSRLWGEPSLRRVQASCDSYQFPEPPIVPKRFPTDRRARPCPAPRIAPPIHVAIGHPPKSSRPARPPALPRLPACCPSPTERLRSSNLSENCRCLPGGSARNRQSVETANLLSDTCRSRKNQCEAFVHEIVGEQAPMDIAHRLLCCRPLRFLCHARERHSRRLESRPVRNQVKAQASLDRKSTRLNSSHRC